MKYSIDSRDYPGFSKGASRIDHMAHCLQAFNPIGLHGAWVEGENIAFYHEERLYLEIIKCNHAENMTVEAFLTGRKAAGIPPFETVRRARQKAQAECPELRGKRTEERKEAEKVYFDFARS